ncbi:MAG: shikimate kinase [Fimbriimonadaceae bacterium]|nr:shikimate kinase [Fimbriimonadaceae bacterium]
MVILVGIMGSGKSVLGMLLADVLDVPFMDTDQLFTQRMGKSIAEWFRHYGETSFREHETAILHSMQPEPAVLSTGGGIVLKQENWDEMRRLGVTVYLDVPPAAIKARLAQSKRRRPLLEFEDWEQRFDKIYWDRRPIYQRADITVTLDFEDLEEAVKSIIEQLGQKWGVA